MRFEPRSAVFPGRGVADHRSLAVVDFASDNLREGVLRPDVYDPALTHFHLYVIPDVFTRYVVG